VAARWAWNFSQRTSVHQSHLLRRRSGATIRYGISTDQVQIDEMADFPQAPMLYTFH
jgi:hypothetical protein